MARSNPRVERCRVHGHVLTYRRAGRGPVLLLVHGIGDSSACWSPLMEALSDRFDLIAPDLPGHGDSGKPRGDYSIGSLASVLRDLLLLLDVPTATLVGHSLGGGVVMQLAYQYPTVCERMALVSSGGLGPEVSPLLRLLTLPMATSVLGVACHAATAPVVDTLENFIERMGRRPPAVLRDAWRAHRQLRRAESRRAFVDTLRTVVDRHGQRIDARERLYLAAELPTLIVWGARDRIVPVQHAYDAKSRIPHAELAVLEHAGHSIPWDEPHELAQRLDTFITSTERATLDGSRFRDLLAKGA